MQAIRTMICVGTIIGYSLFPMLSGRATEAISSSFPKLPAIACAFELFVLSGESSSKLPPREWYLWRQPERVERQDMHRGESEIWYRGRDGQIFYERVFHHDRRLIELVPGDLRALRRYPDWPQLLHMINPTWLQKQLQPTGPRNVLGRSAQHYQGHVDDTEFEVLWLEDEQIPALVRQRYAQREVVLRLREIYPLQQAPWPRAKTKGYQRIDYADLGDKYSDPWVRRIQQGDLRTSWLLHHH